MQKKLLTIFLLLSATVCLADNPSFNLNVLKKGDKAERTVWIRNTTGEPLSVTNVETGCVCTKAVFDKKQIQPGDSTQVVLIFSAKDLGVFYKTISIETTSKECDMKVTLRGRVEK